MRLISFLSWLLFILTLGCVDAAPRGQKGKPAVRKSAIKKGARELAAATVGAGSGGGGRGKARKPSAKKEQRDKRKAVKAVKSDASAYPTFLDALQKFAVQYDEHCGILFSRDLKSAIKKKFLIALCVLLFLASPIDLGRAGEGMLYDHLKKTYPERDGFKVTWLNETQDAREAWDFTVEHDSWKRVLRIECKFTNIHYNQNKPRTQTSRGKTYFVEQRTFAQFVPSMRDSQIELAKAATGWYDVYIIAWTTTKGTFSANILLATDKYLNSSSSPALNGLIGFMSPDMGPMDKVDKRNMPAEHSSAVLNKYVGKPGRADDQNSLLLQAVVVEGL